MVIHNLKSGYNSHSSTLSLSLPCPLSLRVQFFIMAVQSFTEMCVSLQRIDTFLAMEEPPRATAAAAAVPPGLTKGGSNGSSGLVPHPAPRTGTSLTAAPEGLPLGEESERTALLAIPRAAPLAPAAPLSPTALPPSSIGNQGRVYPVGYVALRGADYDWARPLGHDVPEESPHGKPGEGALGGTGPAATAAVAGAHHGGGGGGGGGGAGRGSLELPLHTGPTLRGLVLELRPGELLGITGEVGSGKSSLLAALLGELLPLEKGGGGGGGSGPAQRGESGKASSARGGRGPVVVGSVAYCPQIPWIVSGSVRDNIVFGSRWEPDWYAEVLEACALQQVSGKVGGLQVSGGTAIDCPLAQEASC